MLIEMVPALVVRVSSQSSEARLKAAAAFAESGEIRDVVDELLASKSYRKDLIDKVGGYTPFHEFFPSNSHRKPISSSKKQTRNHSRRTILSRTRRR